MNCGDTRRFTTVPLLSNVREEPVWLYHPHLVNDSATQSCLSCAVLPMSTIYPFMRDVGATWPIRSISLLLNFKSSDHYNSPTSSTIKHIMPTSVFLTTEPFLDQTAYYVWLSLISSISLNLTLIIGDHGDFLWGCFNRCCRQIFHSNSSFQTMEYGRLLFFNRRGGTRCWFRAVSLLYSQSVRCLWHQRRKKPPSSKFRSEYRGHCPVLYGSGGSMLGHHFCRQVVFPILFESSDLPNEANGSLVVVYFGGLRSRYGHGDIDAVHHLSTYRSIDILYARQTLRTIQAKTCWLKILCSVLSAHSYLSASFAHRAVLYDNIRHGDRHHA